MLEILVLIFLLLLSAFFSGSETALFSLKKSDLHRLSYSEKSIERNLYTLMHRPQRVLITILLGNLFVNLIITALSTRFLLFTWGDYGHFISIAVVTPVMILFCEITPKVIAINSYESFSQKVVPFINIFHVLFSPVRYLVLTSSNLIIKIFGFTLENESMTEDELDHAVDLGEKEGIIKKEESSLIKNIMRFSKKDAGSIMFPRNTAFFMPMGTSIDHAVGMFLEAGVIRAPVYKADLDHVVGMVDSRDLLPYYLGHKKAATINRFITSVPFFPASRDLNDLLRDFLEQGIQMAIVVDEFGGTAGVVTLNAILAELMGREFIRGETDAMIAPLKKIDEHSVVISGDMHIEDFNFYFNEKIKSENADTVAGYVIEKSSYFPKRGEKITIKNHVVRVRNIRKNRIISMEVIDKII